MVPVSNKIICNFQTQKYVPVRVSSSSSFFTASPDPQIVNQFESMVKEEVKIDPRVHSMIIGKRGRTIHKIMDDFKVD